MKISIIIPVYNSEKYLKQCLDSILKQTYKNLEIVLVDDGSKDSSLKMCNEYSKSDKRIKVFSKENGGTSSARNYGLKHITGEYVIFIDNDDYILDENSFSNIIILLKKNKPDILLHNCIYYWENTGKFTYPKTDFDRKEIINKNKYEALDYLIKNNIYTYTVWDKVIKTSVIKNNNILFSEGKRNEDSEFCIKILEVTKSYDYCDKPCYVYRKLHSYAQTSTLKYEHTKDLKDLILFYIKKYEKRDNKLKYYIYNYISYLYSVYIAQTYLISDQRINSDIKEILVYKDIIKYDLNCNMKKVSFIYKIFGYKITRRILAFYISSKYKIEKKKI
jgi:glycosyltransferase involved in cell wall biosynthesis